MQRRGVKRGRVKRDLTGGVVMEPLEIHVRISPDDEVQALRARVAALEKSAAELEERANRAEYRYRCEVLVNQELQDLCRAHGVSFREALKSRPW